MYQRVAYIFLLNDAVWCMILKRTESIKLQDSLLLYKKNADMVLELEGFDCWVGLRLNTFQNSNLLLIILAASASHRLLINRNQDWSRSSGRASSTLHTCAICSQPNYVYQKGSSQNWWDSCRWWRWTNVSETFEETVRIPGMCGSSMQTVKDEFTN